MVRPFKKLVGAILSLLNRRGDPKPRPVPVLEDFNEDSAVEDELTEFVDSPETIEDLAVEDAVLEDAVQETPDIEENEPSQEALEDSAPEEQTVDELGEPEDRDLADFARELGLELPDLKDSINELVEKAEDELDEIEAATSLPDRIQALEDEVGEVRSLALMKPEIPPQILDTTKRWTARVIDGTTVGMPHTYPMVSAGTSTQTYWGYWVEVAPEPVLGDIGAPVTYDVNGTYIPTIVKTHGQTQFMPFSVGTRLQVTEGAGESYLTSVATRPSPISGHDSSMLHRWVTSAASLPVALAYVYIVNAANLVDMFRWPWESDPPPNNIGHPIIDLNEAGTPPIAGQGNSAAFGSLPGATVGDVMWVTPWHVGSRFYIDLTPRILWKADVGGGTRRYVHFEDSGAGHLYAEHT